MIRQLRFFRGKMNIYFQIARPFIDKGGWIYDGAALVSVKTESKLEFGSKDRNFWMRNWLLRTMTHF